MQKNISLNNFINREISWLYFNQRVLQEAATPSTPLVERMKFLGIFSNNLDEFFRVRVATLSRMSTLPVTAHDYDGFDPKENLKRINEIVIKQQKDFVSVYRQIVEEMANKNIFILNEKQLNKEQGEYVKNYFHHKVRPHLFPIMIKNFEHSSKLKDKSIYLAVHMQKKEDQEHEDFALIKVPTGNVSRFLILPKTDKRNCIIILDDIIRYCLEDIFSIFDYNIFQAYTIKFTRDAEMDIDNDISKNFMELISECLKQRKQGRPVRFIYDRNIPDFLLNILIKKFKISDRDDLIGGDRYHNFKDFIDFPNIGSSKLEFPVLKPLHHKDLPLTRSFFSCIKQKDILLHFPYQSFEYVIDLLREASIDPDVRSIKMTLYRLASDSNVINALVNAARNGKKVTVYMELQARFNEEANIHWSEKLIDEGVKIIFGIPGLKVHSKLMLIKRKEKGENVYYCNIGTGNYNEETAKVFADESFFTCNPSIAQDVDKVFTLFENKYNPLSFDKLIVSPFYLRNFLNKMLDREIENARAGKKAWIILKLNNLIDMELCHKLYHASHEGVIIKIIARGTCILKSGIPGLSENIEIISIVDRFLEHSRIFVFCNNDKPKYYISSADWMKRNLDYRVEVTCPIEDKNLQKELLDILNIQLSDNTKARLLSSKNYNQYKITKGKKIRSQVEIYNYLKKFVPDKIN
ncbi:MAG TPA: polyphosphate kinase 1 [Bacteroidales bacterium]|nr:polyphosphate kinase 1 [Bacteroidales bacterium]HPS15673.1 polyphosphate kinase 1 [Bacteroidales bacterium]